VLAARAAAAPRLSPSACGVVWHYTLGNEPHPDRYFNFAVR